MNFKQVKLVQTTTDESGKLTTRHTVTWCTTDLAKTGKRVTVEGRDGEWVVAAVYDIVRTSAQLGEDHKAQRRMETVLDRHAGKR